METIGRTLRLGASALLVALTLGAGAIAGCGDDSSDDSGQQSGYAAKPAETGDTTENGTGGGEMTPDTDQPASAGDKKGDAPDDVISDRPGGSGSEPTSP